METLDLSPSGLVTPPHPFVQFLQDRMTRELPGLWGQVPLAPLPMGDKPPGFQVRRDARIGSVLALLSPLPETGNLTLLYTLRSEKLTAHRGQISFPGGGREPGEDAVAAALREAREEVLLDPTGVQVIGQLTQLYIPPSNNYVVPVVGHSPVHPIVQADGNEVDEVFFVDLDFLANPDNLRVKVHHIRDLPHRVPYWDVHPRIPLWGATAMMTSELVTLYREFLGE